MQKVRLLLNDIQAGLQKYPVWMKMGWFDIKVRYRRSIIGPFWITINLFITVSVIGLVFSRLQNQNFWEFFPYVASGFVFWAFFLNTITESCNTFTQAESIIKQIKLPVSFYIFRMIWRNYIIFFHNAVILIPVILFFKVPITFWLLLLPINLLFVSIIIFFMSIFIGAVCARFRDVPQIITSFLQVLFFITPVMWKPEHFGHFKWVIFLNPIYWMIEFIRNPILGIPVSLNLFLSIFFICILCMFFSSLFLAKYRARIPYWV